MQGVYQITHDKQSPPKSYIVAWSNNITLKCGRGNFLIVCRQGMQNVAHVK